MSVHSSSARKAGKTSMRWLLAPAVIFLLVWMIVPLGATFYYSLRRYNLTMPSLNGFAGIGNYRILFGDPAFWAVLGHTVVLVFSSLVITVVL